MIFFILNKIMDTINNDNTTFLFGIIIYLTLFQIKLFQYYSPLIIMTDFYMTFYSNELRKNKNIIKVNNHINIGKYRDLIRKLYIEFNTNKKIKRKFQYENNYKLENLDLEHTIKQTLVNINK